MASKSDSALCLLEGERNTYYGGTIPAVVCNGTRNLPPNLTSLLHSLVPTMHYSSYSEAVDWVQGGLDVGGVLDPTGIADLVNALIYATRGQWGDAGISALAIFPYIGDVGKAGRLGAKTLQRTSKAAAKAVHGNSLKSMKPTWGYKLYSNDGTFLKNGITNKLIPETRYTKPFMLDKNMPVKIQFPNRAAAWEWEFQQNLIQRGPLNLNMH